MYGLVPFFLWSWKQDGAEVFFVYIHRDQLQKVADLEIQECFLQGVVQQSSGLFIYTVL